MIGLQIDVVPLTWWQTIASRLHSLAVSAIKTLFYFVSIAEPRPLVIGSSKRRGDDLVRHFRSGRN